MFFIDKSKMIFLNFLGGIYCITDENTLSCTNNTSIIEIYFSFF